MKHSRLLASGSMIAVLLIASVAPPAPIAAAAACAAPATNYGSVSGLTVSVTSNTTYRVWTRMAAANTTDTNYLLEIDGASCYTVGGASVPTYASGAPTRFKNDATNWISKTIANSQIDVALGVGTHTLKLIGTSPGVTIDRVIMTSDLACIPSGNGDNCATPPDTTAPTVAITSPAGGATITGSTTVVVNAVDTAAVSKVDLYVDNVLKGTDTTADTNSNYSFPLDPLALGLSAGSHTLKAIATDTSNNQATSAVITLTIADTVAPVISAVASSAITQNSATVTWTTDEASDSLVEYGPTPAYGSSTTLNASPVTAHSATLTGLPANTLYYYRVKSKDAGGNITTSADQTLTTAAPAADTTKPTVSLTAPTAGASVSGTITLTATASDNVGVAGVQFLIGATPAGNEDTTSPYSTTYDTTRLANGTYPVSAVARDAAGNTQVSATRSITVNNSTVTYLREDINMDGLVNIADFSLLAAKFGQTGNNLGRADINQDGIVNILDFSLLAAKFR